MVSEITSRITAKDLPISTKHSIVIADFIRYRNLQKTKKILQLVVNKELAIPLKRFYRDRAHRKGGIGPGFYPVKAAKQFILLLNGLEANAKNKGLDVNLLILSEVIPNRAAARWHFGRHRGRMRSTNIEIIAKEEKQKAKKQAKEKK